MHVYSKGLISNKTAVSYAQGRRSLGIWVVISVKIVCVEKERYVFEKDGYVFEKEGSCV